mmetsp:Transcript_11156/g.22402  ORF Transcript_11156/g.22402 Transcript_11156/m.22402 type:complete len:91 (-) Transcript_11156:164-436(-)
MRSVGPGTLPFSARVMKVMPDDVLCVVDSRESTVSRRPPTEDWDAGEGKEIADTVDTTKAARRMVTILMTTEDNVPAKIREVGLSQKISP